ASISTASADLIGKTVNPLFEGITFGTVDENEGTQTVTAAGAHFPATGTDEATIDVTGTQVTITNEGFDAFGASTFNGFVFVFSAGANITGVSVDPASASDFRPTSGGSPAGLNLTSSTEFSVNFEGLSAPAIGDKVIFDLTFGPTSPVPGPIAGAGL